MARYWHIAHPAWTPGQPSAAATPSSPTASRSPGCGTRPTREPTPTGCACSPTPEQGRTEAGWLAEDRPDYHVLLVELDDDTEITRATWEDYPAVIGSVPADAITVMERIGV